MNCCDYECNQGRDCPARSQAKAAKVGKRMHDRAPLRGSPWRRNLKDLARAFLIVLAVVMVSAVTVALIPKNKARYIDCSMAEFHPDITPAAKAACRKQRTTA